MKAFEKLYTEDINKEGKDQISNKNISGLIPNFRLDTGYPAGK